MTSFNCFAYHCIVSHALWTPACDRGLRFAARAVDAVSTPPCGIVSFVTTSPWPPKATGTEQLEGNAVRNGD